LFLRFCGFMFRSNHHLGAHIPRHSHPTRKSSPRLYKTEQCVASSKSNHSLTYAYPRADYPPSPITGAPCYSVLSVSESAPSRSRWPILPPPTPMFTTTSLVNVGPPTFLARAAQSSSNALSLAAVTCDRTSRVFAPSGLTRKRTGGREHATRQDT
jgi:hypothetical protein